MASEPGAPTEPVHPVESGAPADAPKTVIRLAGVHVAFGEKVVLDGLDLEVRKSEILVVLGRSGAGKSVTLKVICGILRPDAGTVTVFKQDLLSLDERGLRHLRQKFGYVFQGGALIAWLTGAENIALPLIEKDLCEPGEVEGRVAKALEMVDLKDAGPLYPDEMSGGMRKRISLARAIVAQPYALLYDEPTTGLDPITTASIDRLIVAAREKTGVTSVVISHDLDSAFRIADRVAMLHKGRIIDCAPPAEFRRSHHAEVRRFLEADPAGE